MCKRSHWSLQPSGLLLYLDSEDEVPEDDDVDRINTRDNLKLALEHENRKKRHLQWKQLEKQVDLVLQHWRARIGLESRQVTLVVSLQNLCVGM